MSRNKGAIGERLNQAQVAIDNAMHHEEIARRLAEFGYDTLRLQAGRDLYEQARALHAAQTREQGEQVTATTEQRDAWMRAEESYMRHVKLARVALKKESGLWHQLMLGGERKQSLWGWIEQASKFYTNALASSDIQARLATLNITRAALEQGRDLVFTLESVSAAQEKEAGEAQQATKERDAAVDDLDDWMADFRAVARVALEGDPQLLEILGIFAPS